jgi:hypothetical protein
LEDNRLNRKIVVLSSVIIIFITIFQPIFNAENMAINNNYIIKTDDKTSLKFEIIDDETKNICTSVTGNTIVFHWPNEDSNYPWNLFKVPLYGIGLENYEMRWDNAGNRNCWEYKQRLIWWTSSLDINGEYTDDPYYDINVDFWQKIEYGCWEGESFMFGGWNVQEAEDPGDYTSWNDLLATLLLFPFFAFPVKQFPLVRADGLLSILCGIEEDIQPTFSWDGTQVYDASGCFEHDFHVEPDTSFSKIFWFRFSSTPGDPFVKTLGIRFKGTTPDPPADLELTPLSQNFGDVKVDSCSDPKSFTLSNNGITSQTIEVRLTNGVLNDWKITEGSGEYTIQPNNDKTIKVKFCPKSKGLKDIELRVNYPGGHLTSDLYGNGEPKIKYIFFESNTLLNKIIQMVLKKIDFNKVI